MLNDIIPYCCYCGERILFVSQRTKEHLVPRSKGGNNSWANKRDCCSKCNNERGNKDLTEWITRLRIQLRNPHLNPMSRYKKEAQLQNAEYLLNYIETAGRKLYRNLFVG